MRIDPFGLGQSIESHSPESVVATYRDGSTLGWVGPSHRLCAHLDDVDQKFVDLLTSVEDRRFWSHRGVDGAALLRALLADAKARAPVQGGSTLTQQLLKNTVVARKSAVIRKLLELPLAPLAELALGKRAILENYLNAIYFGDGLFGLRTASKVFLGKEPKQLSWGEAALLAGLPAGPEAYAFYRPNPLAQLRRDFVLRRANALGLISEVEFRSSLSEAMPQPRYLHSATRDLFDGIEIPPGATHVVTTLDRGVQLTASRVARRAAGNGYCAVASVDTTTGEMLALATRWNHPRRGFDVALSGAMSPGSAVKPFVLAAALEAGFSLDQTYPSGTVDLNVDGRRWRVSNWRNQSFGQSTLTQATLNSDNTIYARVIAELGHERPARVMSDAGLPTSPSPGPSVALGVLNAGVSPALVAASYGTLDGNDFHPPYLFANQVPKCVPQSVSPTARAKVRSVLQQLVTAQVSSELGAAGAFGKTGTPDDGQSGWFVGVHQQLATAVVVSDARSDLPTKARLAAAAWAAFYEELRRVRSGRA